MPIIFGRIILKFTIIYIYIMLVKCMHLQGAFARRLQCLYLVPEQYIGDLVFHQVGCTVSAAKGICFPPKI